MATLNLALNQPQVAVGLNTYTYTVPTGGAALYNVQFQGTFPRISQTSSGAAGSGVGLGAGRGGGTLGGFALGGGGAGDGAVGQGFGVDASGYQQPPAAASNASTTAAVNSSATVLVKNNGSTVYTAPTLLGNEITMKFRFPILLADADVVTVVVASSAAIDTPANVIQTTCSIGQGA